MIGSVGVVAVGLTVAVGLVVVVVVAAAAAAAVAAVGRFLLFGFGGSVVMGLGRCL